MLQKHNLAKLMVMLILTSCCLICIKTTAHPLDEFCNDGSLDPLLCAELAALDRAPDSNSLLPEIELDRSPIDTLALYLKLGVDHILPWGLDHLAFVLALILSTTSLRAILIQISLFTLAHSVTLALGVMGVVQLNSLWVEVAIALSIAYVALENIFFDVKLSRRAVIVFAFGLLHGLGFAGALSELGVPDVHFVSALLGFNLGVEIGQLLFALIGFLFLHKLLHRQSFKPHVFLVTNCLVAFAGGFWLVERLL